MKSAEIADLLRPLLLAFTDSLAAEAKGVPGRPEPVEFTTEPNGAWRSWSEAHADGAVLPKGVYAIRFSDGTALDVKNGWRQAMPEMSFKARAEDIGVQALRNLARENESR